MFFHAANVALVVAFFEVIAFVEKFFPLGECNFDFDQPVLKIDACRDDGLSAGTDFCNELANFPRVEEQFARAVRLMVVGVPEIVFGNVCVVENRDGAVVDADKCVGNIGSTEANCLNFRAGERDSRFKAAFEKIISRGFGIANFGEPFVVFLLTHKNKKGQASRPFVMNAAPARFCLWD